MAESRCGLAQALGHWLVTECVGATMSTPYDTAIPLPGGTLSQVSKDVCCRIIVTVENLEPSGV